MVRSVCLCYDRRVGSVWGEPGLGSGRVVWITGLAGSGKTSVARELGSMLRERSSAVAVLDGDELRAALGVDGFGRAQRVELGLAYARLCGVLARQGLDVVCATISLFSECQEWNRANLPRYFEVYLRVPLDVLAARDPKRIYSRARSGELCDVVGVDLPFDPPAKAELVLDHADALTPRGAAARILRELGDAGP